MPAKVFQPSPEQLHCIHHGEGPMLVRAGAGSGKTTVLVERIARLLELPGVAPENILAFTFTEEAAAQIKRRVTLKHEDGHRVRACTIHSYCFDLLSRNRAGFTALTKEDLWVYLRMQIEERRLPLDYFSKASNPGRFLNDLLDFFERCNDELVSAAGFKRYVEEELTKPEAKIPRVCRPNDEDEVTREEALRRWREIANIFTAAEDILTANNLGSYGHMIVRAVELLESQPALALAERERIKFLLVDEFQDCNSGQIALAKLLTGENGNIFAVGDPDQAIYRFRGATSAAFDAFLSEFPQAVPASLTENYRSRAPILACAHAIVSRNPEPKGEDYRRRRLVAVREKSEKALKSKCVEIVHYKDYGDEAAEVARCIRELLEKQRAEYHDCAVLYRSHAAARAVIEELRAQNVPIDVRGIDLLNSAPVRELEAVLNALYWPQDGISWFLLALRERSGIDAEELHARLTEAKHGTAMTATLMLVKGGKELLASVDALRKKCPPDSTLLAKLLPAAMAVLALDPASLEMKRFCEFAVEWAALAFTRTQRLPEFLTYLDHYRQAGGELPPTDQERRRWKSTNDNTENAVRMMTVHGSKGLEFKHVFALRVTQGSFPGNYQAPLFEFPNELRRGPDEADHKELYEQEERRLCYVAMTRSRDTLTMMGKRRAKEDVPRTYLKEMNEHPDLRSLISVRGPVPVVSSLFAHAPNPQWMDICRDDLGEELSASAIDMYERCPMQFKLSRTWRIDEEPAAAVQFGKVMHDLIRDYTGSFQGEPYSAEQLQQFFRERWAAEPVANSLQREMYLKQGERQLARLSQHFTASPPMDVLETEKQFNNITIGGVRIKGRIDRIDRVAGGVRIVDYKTGNPLDQQAADKSLQLKIYAMAAERMGMNAKELVFHNLEDGTTPLATFSARKMENAEAKIAEVAEAIRNREFKATPSRSCRYCNFFTVCPETEEKLYAIHAATAAQAT